MTCWRGWRPKISENFKLRNRVSCCVSLPRSSFPDNTPLPGDNRARRDSKLSNGGSSSGDGSGGGSGGSSDSREIVFIRTCRLDEDKVNPTGRSGIAGYNKQSNWIIGRILSHFSITSALRHHKVSESDNRQSESTANNPSSASSVSGVRILPKVILKPKMEHAELVKELSHIEKLTNQERLKLAHNRRKLQLKCWNQYEKLINNSSSISSGGGSNKKVLGKNNQQQQKMLEQLQQQEQLRKAKLTKAKPNVRFCNSIMLLEAAGRNDITEVRRLLQDGVDPDVANEDGLTALHQCCIDNNEEMMKLLIESGANVNAEDSERWTPLHAASTCGHLHLVKHLIAKSANLLAVNAEGNMPYDICDEEATLDYIESEMAKRGVTQELIEDIRALPETRMLEDMQRLEAEDGDLEARDRDGATYLHIASANGYSRVVEFLLDHHVATDVQDKDFWQPVHAAACWSHVEVLELLVGAGADLNARTKNNETPYAICEDLEIKERIIQLRSEQETKMKESGVKKLRRSVSSNSRTQSIRRTSQRDKQNATKRDAADEAAMLLAIATKDSSPSPTGDKTLVVTVTGGDTLLAPPTDHQASITSSEEETEIRSLPPWSQGRDSITELHMESLGVIRKSLNIPIETDSSSADESPRLNNISNTNGVTKGLKNVNQGGESKILRERNELNRSLKETGGTKFQNPLSLPVSNPSLVLTDTNANLPNPDITPHVEVQPIKNSAPVPASAGGVRICDSSDSILDVGNPNSTIDIRVQVTINTNGSCTGSLNSLTTPSTGTYPSSPRGSNQIVQVSGPVFTPPGTLSDLKKQRSLSYVSISRNSNTFPLNGLKDFPAKYEPPPSPTSSLKKFAGESVGMVGDDSDGRRKCCTIV